MEGYLFFFRVVNSVIVAVTSLSQRNLPFVLRIKLGRRRKREGKECKQREYLGKNPRIHNLYIAVYSIYTSETHTGMAAQQHQQHSAKYSACLIFFSHSPDISSKQTGQLIGSYPSLTHQGLLRDVTQSFGMSKSQASSCSSSRVGEGFL